MRQIRSVVFLALLLCCHDAAADHDVNAPGPMSGSLIQSIPIDVPAFRGLEPRLALAYASEGGSGFAGVGWSLAGFSVVERAKPGRGTPLYNASDIYLLNGQELIPCPQGSSSPSCTTGGSHTTKNESYMRILFDSQNNAWTVWGKDGTRTVHAAVYQAASGTLRWGQTSIVDPRGNAVSYVWECAGGDCYPSSVSYGAYAVTFYRESRPDTTKFAIGITSTLGETLYRLRSILVKRSGSPIRAYKLSYVTSGSTGRSLLASVQQFGRDVAIDGSGTISGGTASPAQTFIYQQDPQAHMFDAPSVTVSSSPACHPTCTVTFTAAPVDDEGDSMTVSWSGCASGTGLTKTCQVTSMATITATATATDSHGTSASASKSVQPANQTPSITNPGNKTWAKNTDVSFQFTVTDDDPASTGSCVNYVVPSPVGTKQGCAYWQGSKWQADLHTSSSGGTGTISWTYKDQWGAPVNGSFTATVQ